MMQRSVCCPRGSKDSRRFTCQKFKLNFNFGGKFKSFLEHFLMVFRESSFFVVVKGFFSSALIAVDDHDLANLMTFFFDKRHHFQSHE